MRQLCPHCFHSIELPDAVAGHEASCPDCGKGFHVPGGYEPKVDPAAAAHDLPAKPEPLPLVITPTIAPAASPQPGDSQKIPPPPPGVRLEALAGTAAAIHAIQNYSNEKHDDQTPSAEGPSTTRTIVLSPRILEPIPVVCFTLIFLLTFATWVGCCPGGYRAYTQSPWEAMFGSFETDHFAEKVLKKETALNERMHSNVILLLPYLLGVLVVTGIAWADLLVKEPIPAASPILEAVARYWPERIRIMLGLALVLGLLILLQTRIGFGLESAVRGEVTDEFAQQIEKGDNSATKQEILMTQAQTLNKFELRSTFWQTLALSAHVLTALALAGRWWLGVRGNKPLPRVSVSW